MNSRTRFFLSTWIIFLAGSGFAAEPPEYKPVAAKLVQTRAGLGRFVEKVEAGKTVRVAYLGGSITAQPGWRLKSLAWLQKKYPQAKISEINAAIGGTGSDLGVYRLEHDVLRHKPDLMFVEFAVNDGQTSPHNIWRGMEGIVRQTWAANPETEICFVYTFREGYELDLAKGENPRAASADEMLAEHYGIPSINFALRISQLHEQKKLIIASKEENIDLAPGITLFSKDGVHPLDAGHERYQDVFAEAWPAIAAQRAPVDHVARMSKPFVADHWQAAQLLPVRPEMFSEQWKQLAADSALVTRFGPRVDSLWEATQAGAKLKFRFRGTTAKLYDLLGPDGGQVTITVDGKSRGPVARFDKFCTYHRLATLNVATDLPPGEHEVLVELHPDQPDRSSVTDIEKAKPGFDPKKYDGTALRVGGILVLGEILPSVK